MTTPASSTLPSLSPVEKSAFFIYERINYRLSGVLGSFILFAACSFIFTWTGLDKTLFTSVVGGDFSHWIESYQAVMALGLVAYALLSTAFIYWMKLSHPITHAVGPTLDVVTSNQIVLADKALYEFERKIVAVESHYVFAFIALWLIGSKLGELNALSDAALMVALKCACDGRVFFKLRKNFDNFLFKKALQTTYRKTYYSQLNALKKGVKNSGVVELDVKNNRLIDRLSVSLGEDARISLFKNAMTDVVVQGLLSLGFSWENQSAPFSILSFEFLKDSSRIQQFSDEMLMLRLYYQDNRKLIEKTISAFQVHAQETRLPMPFHKKTLRPRLVMNARNRPYIEFEVKFKRKEECEAWQAAFSSMPTLVKIEGNTLRLVPVAKTNQEDHPLAELLQQFVSASFRDKNKPNLISRFFARQEKETNAQRIEKLVNSFRQATGHELSSLLVDCISYKTIEGDRLLLYPIKQNHPDEVALLLSWGVDFSTLSDVSTGDSVLHIAARHNDLAILESIFHAYQKHEKQSPLRLTQLVLAVNHAGRTVFDELVGRMNESAGLDETVAELFLQIANAILIVQEGRDWSDMFDQSAVDVVKQVIDSLKDKEVHGSMMQQISWPLEKTPIKVSKSVEQKRKARRRKKQKRVLTSEQVQQEKVSSSLTSVPSAAIEARQVLQAIEEEGGDAPTLVELVRQAVKEELAQKDSAESSVSDLSSEESGETAVQSASPVQSNASASVGTQPLSHQMEVHSESPEQQSACQFYDDPGTLCFIQPYNTQKPLPPNMLKLSLEAAQMLSHWMLSPELFALRKQYEWYDENFDCSYFWCVHGVYLDSRYVDVGQVAAQMNQAYYAGAITPTYYSM